VADGQLQGRHSARKSERRSVLTTSRRAVRERLAPTSAASRHSYKARIWATRAPSRLVGSLARIAPLVQSLGQRPATSPPAAPPQPVGHLKPYRMRQEHRPKPTRTWRARSPARPRQSVREHLESAVLLILRFFACRDDFPSVHFSVVSATSVPSDSVFYSCLFFLCALRVSVVNTVFRFSPRPVKTFGCGSPHCASGRAG